MNVLEGRGVWRYAVIASLIAHGALAMLIPSAICYAKPEPIMNVRLTTAEVPQKVAEAPVKETPKQKPEPRPKQKTVQKPVKKLVRPAASVNPVLTEISASPSAAQTLPVATTSATDETMAEPSTSAAPASHSVGAPVDVITLQITKKIIPEYPSFSRKRREEGTVKVIITINNGRVVESELEESSGFERLDSSAVRAVRQWRFNHQGTIRARVPITFKLN